MGEGAFNMIFIIHSVNQLKTAAYTSKPKIVIRFLSAHRGNFFIFKYKLFFVYAIDILVPCMQVCAWFQALFDFNLQAMLQGAEH